VAGGDTLACKFGRSENTLIEGKIMIMIIILDRQHENADIHPKIAIKIAGLYS